MNDPRVSTFLIENCVEKKLWVTSRRFSHITNYQVVCEFHCFDDFLECTLYPARCCFRKLSTMNNQVQKKVKPVYKSMMRQVLQCEARRRQGVKWSSLRVTRVTYLAAALVFSLQLQSVTCLRSLGDNLYTYKLCCIAGQAKKQKMRPRSEVK